MVFDPVTNPATTIGDVDLVRSGREDAEPACDGLHDERAPAHHLCTICYPDGVVAAEIDDYGYDEEEAR